MKELLSLRLTDAERGTARGDLILKPEEIQKLRNAAGYLRGRLGNGAADRILRNVADAFEDTLRAQGLSEVERAAEPMPTVRTAMKVPAQLLPGTPEHRENCKRMKKAGLERTIGHGVECDCEWC